MAQLTLKPLWAAIASIVALSVVTAIKPANAFNVTSDFTVQMTSDAYENQGLKQGATAYGSFTYDNTNLIGIGSEYVSGSRGNLTLQFNFLNKAYTEQDDLNYLAQSYLYDYPAAFFADGKLLGLDFLVVPSTFQPPQSDLGFRIFKDVFYVGSTANFNSGTLAGTVSYGNGAAVPEPSAPDGGTLPKPEPSAPVNTAAVPEPSEVGGALVAFSCLGIWAMRKVKG